MRLLVALNGTDENPFHKLGLNQNPFPQVADHRYIKQVVHLQALGGDPIKDEQQIRDHLKGWSDEFVELCCKNFKKGEYVRFTVEFPG